MSIFVQLQEACCLLILFNCLLREPSILFLKSFLLNQIFSFLFCFYKSCAITNVDICIAIMVILLLLLGFQGIFLSFQGPEAFGGNLLLIAIATSLLGSRVSIEGWLHRSRISPQGRFHGVLPQELPAVLSSWRTAF